MIDKVPSLVLVRRSQASRIRVANAAGPAPAPTRPRSRRWSRRATRCTDRQRSSGLRLQPGAIAIILREHVTRDPATLDPPVSPAAAALFLRDPPRLRAAALQGVVGSNAIRLTRGYLTDAIKIFAVRVWLGFPRQGCLPQALSALNGRGDAGDMGGLELTTVESHDQNTLHACCRTATRCTQEVRDTWMIDRAVFGRSSMREGRRATSISTRRTAQLHNHVPIIAQSESESQCSTGFFCFSAKPFATSYAFSIAPFLYRIVADVAEALARSTVVCVRVFAIRHDRQSPKIVL